MAPGSEAAWLEDRGDHLRLRLKVQPRARQDEVVGPTPKGFLKVRLTAAPVAGQANRRLLKFLARVLEVSANRVELVSGEKSHRKVVRVTGLSAEQGRARLTG